MRDGPELRRAMENRRRPPTTASQALFIGCFLSQLNRCHALCHRFRGRLQSHFQHEVRIVHQEVMSLDARLALLEEQGPERGKEPRPRRAAQGLDVGDRPGDRPGDWAFQRPKASSLEARGQL